MAHKSLSYAKLFPVVSPGKNPALEPLFKNDATGKPLPWLATGFKEDVANKSITLTIREDQIPRQYGF